MVYNFLKSVNVSKRTDLIFLKKLMLKEGYKKNQEGPESHISCLGTWFCLFLLLHKIQLFFY